ncbi:hypothetical protein [Marinifilum caeruleilacunae]|uniref:Uncharacterized protein n=1 Tax=Marinifilum caeruleilacunae TaxID=2499076 RepID=A0ABX1WYD8_9BACT|nr:hypothetical protein [Marinifilum caeruleilacunae]NOU60996.1 hypothetical protein [Marinifilum caeruleilacunae]
MKKLQKLLLLAIFSIGIFGTAKAQVPTVDATQNGVVAGGKYTYTVPNTAGQSWTWTIIDNTGAILDGTGGEYAMVDVEDYEKEITWNTNGTFYVLVETTIDLTGCTNQYAIQVNVASNDYTVAFNAGTTKVYCADDANIASGLEMTLDITLAGGAPAAAYYDMEVQFQVDGGATQTATIGADHKFNIPGITIADPVAPAMANITVTIVKVTDKNGVEFTPLAADQDLVIAINPIPAKPTISF